jgi:hypothetical protein
MPALALASANRKMVSFTETGDRPSFSTPVYLFACLR